MAERIVAAPERLRSMRPVTFGGCFGWLHPTPDGWGSDTAVLLCSGLTYDKLCGHRSFRQLADTLAAAGYPALRFDYPDTGDSHDAAGDTEHWLVWQRSIHGAADWLRDHTGARRIVLIGLRIGATLATVVAEKRDDVAGLVLLEPVLRGQSYIRHLSVTLSFRGADQPQTDERLDLHELLLSKETLKKIGHVDLRKVAPPHGCRVAVFAQAQSPVLSAFATAWRSLETDVELHDFAGLEPFVRPTFMNHEASADVTRLMAWLGRAVPASPCPPMMGATPEWPSLRAAGWIETPIRFGAQDRLFGMLCGPDAGAAAERVVIIVNSSGHPHHGDNRLAVELARRLAPEGIASLRIDFAGLGDSSTPGEDGELPTHIMEADRKADISAAIDVLESLGYREFAVQGLCTGAYHALHGAIADPRLDAALLVNLPMFAWHKGDRVETIGAHGPTQYLRWLGRAATWKLLLKRQLHLARPLYGLRMKLEVGCEIMIRRLAYWLGCRAPASFAHRGMEILSGRNVRTLFLYSSDDVGLQMFETEFPAGSVAAWNATMRIVPDVDHSLSRSTMRRVVIDQILGFLKGSPA